MDNIRIGLIKEYYICPYCGKEFFYNGYNIKSRLDALTKYNKHIESCKLKNKNSFVDKPIW